MNNKILMFIICILLVASSVSAVTVFSSSGSSARLINTQSYPSLNGLYSSSDINTYWPIVDSDGQCRARQDVLLQIAPAGCQPTVVRTDLLGDQNVPVLCQLQALQINPLIDIKAIDSITFSGRYPKEVATTGYYPAQAALSTGNTLLSNPLINNAGYVVVILKRNQNESSLPDSVTLNLTARLRYDSYNALGVGQASFILDEQTEGQFSNASFRNSFWQGRYFIRADTIAADSATISIYYQDRKITTLRVEKGKQSQQIYIPGFSTCQASLSVAYDGFESSGSNRARIEVQDGNKKTDVFDVYDGSSFANGKCRVSGDIAANIDGTGSIGISCSGDRTTLSLANNASILSENELNQTKKNYLAQVRATIVDYRTVAELYSAETDSSGTAYGEIALQRALDLIRESTLGGYLKPEYTDLIALYKNKYSDSTAKIAEYEKDYEKILQIGNGNSAAVFQIDNKYVTVKVLGFTRAEKQSKVKFNVGNRVIDYESGKDGSNVVGNVVSFPSVDGKSNYKFAVTKINPDEVTIKPDCPGYQGGQQSETLSEKEQTTICGVSVRVEDINAEKLAKVRIIPKVDNTQTETNLTVKIGIEKRAIQLSPEKATKMINNLNESIKKFESISKTLNSATKALKTACFATAGYLTAKNLLSGLDGTSIARKEVMSGDYGWTAKCTEAFKNPTSSVVGVASGPYVSIDDCLRKNSEAINNDVEAAKNVISSQNNAIKAIDAKYSTATKPFGTVVDTDKSAKDYITYLKSKYSDDPLIGATVSELTVDSYPKDISYDQLKQLEYSALITKSGASQVQIDAANSKVDLFEGQLQKNLETSKVTTDFAKELGVNYEIPVFSTTDTPARPYYGGSTGTDISGLPEGKPVQFFVADNVRYAAILDSTNGKSYVADSLYQISGKTATLVQSTDSNKGLFKSISGGFVKKDANSFINPYTNAKVKYFDSEPNKGTPAVVPIDVKEGWYAGVKQVLPVLGQQSSAQSSGKVSSFYICNVGEDGLEEFDKSGFGGDDCTLFNPYTGQTPQIGVLDSAKAASLVRRAENLLTQAAQQYASGVKQVRIDGQSYGVENALNVPSVRCQDYMSPKECQLLFNVCDPVICPSSRCNLGGQYYVANVPETGIVGSALLCLPNAKEGIVLPVCLTGLASGVDGFVSIMQSHRDCLQEQLETGKTVGICDQIYSVYMCEFFWRQVAPVANVLLPKLVESAYGQSSNGGGEYLTVMNAWKQTQESINYFTQTYAVNSIKAFQVRSVEEAGGEFCKAFASIKAPTSFDSLVEPDSPPQFHAWFSSIKYSDATVPATAQYKVYYHIFAGKDSGVSYQVYLKDPATISVVSVPQQLLIASDFITRGQYASETKDFTAPEGYKQLCVNVNGREECGFGQVTTSFALDYLADSTRADTLTQTNIKGTQECVSGSIGDGITLNPNLQATAESAANSQIYNQGIIRVCATTDPGATSAPGRFIKVGICDSESMGCWLDSESTARALTQENNGTKTEVTATLEELQKNNDIATQQSSGNILTDEGFGSALSSIKERLSGSKNIKTDAPSLLNSIDGNISKSYQGKQKAQLQLLRGDVQKSLAEVLVLSLSNSVGKDATTTTNSAVSSGSTASTSSTTSQNQTVEVFTELNNSTSSSPGTISQGSSVSGTTNTLLNDAIKKVNELSGDYGKNKAFIDELYNNGKGVISETEYIEINGKGIANFEEDMFYVHRILAQKVASSLISKKGQEGLTDFKAAPTTLEGKGFYTDQPGEASQLYLAELPMPIYVSTYNKEQTVFMPDKKTLFAYAPIVIGQIFSSQDKLILSLNSGATESNYLGNDLYNLLQESVIATSASDISNDMPALSEEDLQNQAAFEQEMKDLQTTLGVLHADTGKNQYTTNLRYSSNIIKYYLDNGCSNTKKDAVNRARLLISSKVGLNFEESSQSSANIVISCSNEIGPIVEESSNALGTTTLGSYQLSGEYAIFSSQSSIVLYNASESVLCDWDDVALHELLHALGFGHNDDTNSVMYYTADSKREVCRSGSLDQYIIDQLRVAYNIL